jgi:hypothetical protein
MKFLLGFLFGANYIGNRVFRVAFLLLILFMVFCLYQMSKTLGHNRRVAAPSADIRCSSRFAPGGGGAVVPHCSLL